MASDTGWWRVRKWRDFLRAVIFRRRRFRAMTEILVSDFDGQWKSLCGYIDYLNTSPDKQLNEAGMVIEHLCSKIDELTEALEFYADPSTYHACGFMFDPPTGGFDKDFDANHGDNFYDRPMPGKTARGVLKWGNAIENSNDEPI